MSAGLQALFRDHALWVNSNGDDGERAGLADTSLAGKDLARISQTP